jgi:hypothetical protein
VSFGGTRAAPAQQRAAAEIVRASPDLDLALVRLASSLNAIAPGVFRRAIHPRSSLGLVGKSVSCVGWGDVEPPDRPAQATLSIESISGPLFRLPTNGRGQALAAGDAGGGCFLQDGVAISLAAILVGVDGSGAGVAVDLTTPEVRSWIEGSMIGRGPDVAVGAASTPAAAVDGDGQIQLFWVDAVGDLRHAPLLAPTSVESLGSPPGDPFTSDAPAAVYLGDDRHVFAHSATGAAYWKDDGPASRTPGWSLLIPRGTVASGIGAASWQPDQMAIFARSGAQTGLHGAYKAGQWRMIEDIGGILSLGVSAVMWSQDRLDAFTTTGDGRVWHAFGSPDVWTSLWMNEITGTVASDCAVVSWGYYKLDLFARNAEGRLAHYALGDAGWSDAWTDTTIDVPGPPVAVIAGGQLHLFARNSDGTVWHAYWPR